MKRFLPLAAVLPLAACSATGTAAHTAAAASPSPQLSSYCDVTFPANSLVQPHVAPGPAGFVMDVQVSSDAGPVYVKSLRILVVAGSVGHDETVTEPVAKTVGPEVNGKQTVLSFAAPDVGHGFAPGGCQVEGWSS